MNDVRRDIGDEGIVLYTWDEDFAVRDRIFTTSFASVYPHYVTKVERKGRTKDELDRAITDLHVALSEIDLDLIRVEAQPVRITVTFSHPTRQAKHILALFAREAGAGRLSPISGSRRTSSSRHRRGWS